MRATFSWPVQLPQAAAQGFDLLLVGYLLPLGQFEGFEHCLHLVQRGSKHLDDVVDLFDRFLDSHRLCGSQLPGWWWQRLPRLTHWRSGSCPQLTHRGQGSIPRLVRWRQGSLPLGREGFRPGLNRLGGILRGCERLLAGGSGCSRSAPATPATTASAAPHGLRCSGSLRRCAFQARFRFGVHVFFKLP